MYKVGWDYPLHLGVTEAGEGEDGRMKSAIGIGALLLDGLGDTIRVSLTEAPEFEIDPCTRLRDVGTIAASNGWGVPAYEEAHRDFKTFTRRKGDLPAQKAGDAIDFRGLLHRDGSVLSAVTAADLARPEHLYRALGAKLAVGMPFKDIATADSILLREVPAASAADQRTALRRLQESGVGVIVPFAALAATPLPNAVALVSATELHAAKGKPALPEGAGRVAVAVDGTESDEVIAAIKAAEPVLVLLSIKEGVSRVHASRRIFETMARESLGSVPVIHHLRFHDKASKDEVVIQGGSEAGALLVDGLGDGVLLEAPSLPLDEVRFTAFGMLQGSRMRNTKTEFVSCPSCGRTLFDLQEVTQSIQKRTGHLPGVAIAVMGCIVNGPGEMADADFGYVGGAPGKIDLYVGKEVVKRAIPNELATDELIQLIKDNGRWVEPPVPEPALAA